MVTLPEDIFVYETLSSWSENEEYGMVNFSKNHFNYFVSVNIPLCRQLPLRMFSESCISPEFFDLNGHDGLGSELS